MQIKTYNSLADSSSKFVLWSEEDCETFNKTTLYFGNNVLDPTSNIGSTKLESFNLFRELEEKYKLGSTDESTLMTLFPPPEKNLFFLFGEGNMKITYSDGSEQIVESQYSGNAWVDYTNVWQYNKECYFHLYGRCTLLQLTLPEGLTTSQYSIKISSVKSEDGSLQTLTKDIVNTDNQIFIYSPSFNFNAKVYTDLDFPKGLIKSFNNQAGFTLRTSNYASAIYMEKL
jgi:hypothetical protein